MQWIWQLILVKNSKYQKDTLVISKKNKKGIARDKFLPLKRKMSGNWELQKKTDRSMDWDLGVALLNDRYR